MITTALSTFPEEDTGQYREDPVVNVIQDGARLHYALPVALQRQGILGTVFTDWFVRPGSREDRIAHFVRRFAPDLGKRLADRCCLELDSSRVVSSYRLALHEWAARAVPVAPERRHLRLSKSFTRWISQQDWRGANAVIGFARNIDPQLCAVAKRRRLITLIDQMIAPAATQLAEANRQAKQWPNWCGYEKPLNLDPMMDLERRTWSVADHITCPSAYVRDGLLEQGIASQKISVIPYPIDIGAFRFFDRRDRSGPVLVGFVGAVDLRKGAPAFFDVAWCFAPGEVKFVMVGPVGPEIRRALSFNGRVELTGAVPRSQVLEWLERFDIFLFPSTCEGSAGAVMEALATGLPVITTPNSGTVIRHGIEGFICASDDISGFVQCLDRLRKEPALRARMGTAARMRVLSFDLDHYGQCLDRVLRKLLIQRASPLGSGCAARPTA